MFKEIFNWLKIGRKNLDYRAKYPIGHHDSPDYPGQRPKPLPMSELKYDQYGLPIIVKTPPTPQCKPCKKATNSRKFTI